MKAKHIIPVLITFAAAVLLSTCKERDCGDPEYFALKELDKYVSYKGTETLRFLHNSTDTQYFVGEGLKRLIVTTHPQKEDGECSEQHEAVSIQFRNNQNNAILKLEYIYDRMAFGSAQYAPAPYTYLKFYYRNSDFPGGQTATKNFFLNGVDYAPIVIFKRSADTSEYVAYSFSIGGTQKGIVKVKTLGDTLTFIP